MNIIVPTTAKIVEVPILNIEYVNITTAWNATKTTTGTKKLGKDESSL